MQIHAGKEVLMVFVQMYMYTRIYIPASFASDTTAPTIRGLEDVGCLTIDVELYFHAPPISRTAYFISVELHVSVQRNPCAFRGNFEHTRHSQHLRQCHPSSQVVGKPTRRMLDGE